MAASEARIRANRENAKRSTGPKTPEGKARVRCNALKHGLTGRGVALPAEDQAEITRRFVDLQEELRPKTDAGSQLVRRFAFLSVRIERCERHETVETSKRVRHAIADYDDARLASVEALATRLYSEPATTVRRLQMTPEGIDWLLKEWGILRDDMLYEDGKRWTGNHRMHFDALLGLNPGGYRVARIMALSEAMTGFFHHLDKADGQDLEGPARAGWAKGELTRIIDVEVARLKGARASFDHEALAADRAEAVDRALFDPSKEAILARKYEAATERAMYKALKELRQVEADAAEGIDSDITVETEELCDPLALNSGESEEETAEAEPEPSPTLRMVSPGLPEPRTTGLPAIERPYEGPMTVEGPILAPCEGSISV